jgi:phage terminase small subunit
MTLTPKQELFVREYLVDLNATQAAIRAGYSEKNASRIAAELLGKTHVRDAVEQAKAERSEKVNVDAAWVLRRLADEATADIADLYNEEGKLLPVHEWPLIWRQGLVQGIEVEELFDGFGKDREQIGWVRKIRLSDRVKRLELIGKHIGVKAFEDQVSVTGIEALADRLARASKRDG